MGHGWPAAFSTSLRRQPRATCPSALTLMLGTPRARSSAEMPSPVASAHRSGNRPASRSARAGHCRPLSPPNAFRTSARTSRRGVVFAERDAGQRARSLAQRPGALGDPLGIGQVQVERAHHQRMGGRADLVAEPGVDLGAERGGPDAVLVRRRAEHHVVGDLVHHL